jgi:hypothetical protein
MEEDAFLVQPNYMWEYPLVSASEENLLSHFGECFFIICSVLRGTDIAMHPETSQSKVWYPYILRSCGVHYRNNYFLSGIAEVSIHSGLNMLTIMCFQFSMLNVYHPMDVI